jgi:SAM-dependent methyltransferase
MSETGAIGFQGEQAEVKVEAGNPETLKYGKLWENPEGGDEANLYRKVAPGEALATEFMKVVRPKAGADVVDFGCGTGRGGLMLAVLGMRVTLVDFVRNCLDTDVKAALVTQSHVLRFIKHDLEKKMPFVAEYGFCTDVMEHIPSEKVTRVLMNILMGAQHVFFSISTEPDSCGRLIGETLHLTVQPYEWWLDQFNKLGCMIHWSKKTDGGALFYVSAWQKGQEIVDVGVLNTTDQVLRDNVKVNINGPYGERQIHPFATNDLECIILGGGPTAKQYLPQMKAMRENGAKLITLNGAYNWALAHDLKPSATVICDAREFNKRFVTPVIPECKYLMNSQVHPAVLESLPLDQTLLWHTTSEDLYPILKERYPLCFPIPGGSTVLLRTLPLMRTLGYRKFHLFGCDSCIVTVDGLGVVHHGYEQPENDKDPILPLIVGGRSFGCTTWMVSQAQEFQDLIRMMGDVMELEIYGDGLLAWLLTFAASDPLPITTPNADKVLGLD